jgi:D-alanine--poly(phosphoribitol) ligase subunit 2
MAHEQHILSVLSQVVETPEVLRDPDMRWYDLGLVDSLRTVELIVALETEYNLVIAPTEVDATAWETPRATAAFVMQRLQAAARPSH